MHEGYNDSEHSHWLSPQGVEVVTAHASGQRMPPNCYVRAVPEHVGKKQ